MSLVSSEIIAILIEKFDFDDSTINPHVRLKDLGADSLDIVEFMVELENLYNLQIPDTAIESKTSIDEIIRYIEERQ